MAVSIFQVVKSNWKKSLVLGGISIVAILAATSLPQTLMASDHDDGEVDAKGRSLNLTDLYAFREQDQNPNANPGDLVLVMNSNPRSIARQQYYFSTNARYEFKLTRVADKDATPTGREDITLRFEFGAPNDRQQQQMKLTVIKDGKETAAKNLSTTPLGAPAPIVNQLAAAGSKISVFAGLREDPFVFDVEQFFRVRAGALGIGPAVGFRPSDRAVDSFKGFNVNSIAIRIPQKFLQGTTEATTYDIWETISLRDPATGKYQQVERLARPAINEGLIVSNDLLNTFNSVPPTADLSPAAAPIGAEAVRTLKALGNDEARTNALLTAFLPDVMRIDTTAPSGYGNALNAKGSPIRGRLIKDDVIDITLSVLTNGAIKGDNATYEGTPGNPAQGHKPLEGSFPYLALPN
ncbi:MULTISPECIES: DUF4331 domain-containing protein [unclassified Chamaesiphon]|uniref:DUF4331 domain-containing protein n=1 Tax=unclassified Chamaesiphon TaxID=2620921 RepID=UPI00286ACE56|nr:MULTISPECIES: DUF4331 domain-containing protein [unclassified Chamaesiphon]